MRNARFTSRRGPDDATAVFVFQEAAHASRFIDAWNKLITSPTLEATFSIGYWPPTLEPLCFTATSLSFVAFLGAESQRVGKLEMRLDEFGRSFVHFEHRKKTDKAHLILRTLDEFDIPYLRALLDNDSRSMLLYCGSFIAEKIVP
ncbi:hypothetical protein B0H13DRAFT_2299924 [Mycena leptocephala]|nr:hypothetical protein B0H13DRAFT_2299924 [Mycena leptocephala]